ncbi:uncharacterized protein G2W53_026432 [Senna tora]|uniref:Uncharacterized protein n=1 Tax=Senna tora TaxID=362788 RepID=A0A834TF36_9FABA|nr:uncharacterized protein G2W53_026432 [Senna tora]
MLRHDPRSSHAKTTPIPASKPLRFANTTRTDVFHSLSQQVFCLVIRESLRDPTTISRLEYVKTRSTLLPCHDDSNSSIKTTPNMLRYDPHSSHAMKTPIGASKPLRFANTTRTDVFHSLAQQLFGLVIHEVSKIQPRFLVWNMLRHDPRSSHAMTTLIGASNPLGFTNTRRTDVFHSLAQQVFWLVIREGFRDLTAISCPEYVMTRSTILLCHDDSNWSIKTTPVSEIRPQFVIRNMLRQDPRSSHALTTPIGASKPLWFANITRTDVFHSLPQQVFCLVIREGHDPRSSHAMKTPIGASNPLRHDPRFSHAMKTPIGASKQLRFAKSKRTDVFNSLAQQNMLRHHPRSSHAKTTPIGASKPLRFVNTMRTDMFDSLAQQVFCLVIREGF